MHLELLQFPHCSGNVLGLLLCCVAAVMGPAAANAHPAEALL
jgi:hypothetical protein